MTSRPRLCLLICVAAACGRVHGEAVPADATTGTGDGAGSDGPVLELLAGNIGGPGSVDGTGAAARFNFLQGVAIDGAGNLYVSDTGNNVIRKVTPAGAVTTLAGTAGTTGSADGTGAAARFHDPRGIALDAAGNVFVADTSNRTIRKITPAGVVTTFAGTAGVAGSEDGAGTAAQFGEPLGLAIDATGNLFVADAINEIVRKISPAGVVITFAGAAGERGSIDATGDSARFDHPEGVATDSAGNVYVSDANNNTIRKLTPARVVTTIAGTPGMPGSSNGSGGAARFNFPDGLAVDGAGNVFVADASNHIIRKITPAGAVTTIAGVALEAGSADGGASARFALPFAVAVDGAGNLFIADGNNHALRKLTPAGIVTTIAGVPGLSGAADGTGGAAQLHAPLGLAVDAAGTIFVADTGNNAIRAITSDGVVSTLAGTAATIGSADGTGAAARFNAPEGIAVDGAGNVWVSDSQNHTIREITPAGVVSTIAGSAGTSGSADGPAASARFALPFGVALDAANNLVIVDNNNDTIRKLTSDGAVNTFAGAAHTVGSADGGTAARFNRPTGAAFDAAGNLYIADASNHTIRKITPDGVVATLAGTAGVTGSADDTGAAASFHFPESVAVDHAGNVYVTDLVDATIRKITPDGVTTTVAGTPGIAGIVLGNQPRFTAPAGIAIRGDSLVISDSNAILLLRHAIAP